MKIPTTKLTGFSRPEWWAEVYEDQPESVNAASRKFWARIRAKSPQPESLGQTSAPQIDLEAATRSDPDVTSDYLGFLAECRIVGSVTAWCWDDPVSAATVAKLPHAFVDELIEKLNEQHGRDRTPKESAALKN